MLRIGLLFGGNSGEHEVSLCSASSVYFALDKEKYDVLPIGIDHDGKWYPQFNPEFIEDKDFGKVFSIKKNGKWFVNHFPDNNKCKIIDIDSKQEVSLDIILPILHGTFCEDGTLQGLLELMSVPYVGAGVLGSSLAMDKDLAKIVMQHSGIPVVPWITVYKDEWKRNKLDVTERIKKEIGFPFFVKPANAGSSVGIHKVKDENALDSSINDSLKYDIKVLIEKAIDCREIECAVLGNLSPRASALGEIVPNAEFYSYEAKYIDKNGAVLTIPANIDESKSKEIMDIAINAYRSLNLSGLSRVDFLFDKNSDDFYLNEINTLPGFTSISMYPKLWEYSGKSYGNLLDDLIELALDRFNQKKEIVTRY